MATQVISLGTPTLEAGPRYGYNLAPAVSLDDALVATATSVFYSCRIFEDGQIGVSLGSTTSSSDNRDFTAAFETSGHIVFAISGAVLELVGTGADTSEPYTWTPSNSDEVEEFYDSLGTAVSTTLILSDAAAIVVADAGPDQSNIAAGATVTLDGSGSSEISSDTFTYAWEETTSVGVALSDDAIANPTFTAPTRDTEQTITLRLTVTNQYGLTATDDVTITVNANQRPTADAGDDQTGIAASDTVMLDGSGSSDADGTITTYAWTQQSGPAITLINPNTATPSFVAPSLMAEGTVVLLLTVTDNGALVDSDTVSITIAAAPPVNMAPTADAGPDQSNIQAGAMVTLDGSGSSDPDMGDTLTYLWEQTAGANVVLSDTAAESPTFTAPIGNAQTLTFRLTVTDSGGLTNADTVNILVNANQGPTANAGADRTVGGATTVTLDGSGSSDPEGHDLTYAWTQTTGPDVSLSNADTATPSFVAPNQSVNLVFELEVTDSGGLTNTDTVTIMVSATLPIARAGADQAALAGATVMLDGARSSAGTNLTLTGYAWEQISGADVTLTNANQALASFVAPSTVGELVFRLTVTDSNGSTQTDDVTVFVHPTDTQAAVVYLTEDEENIAVNVWQDVLRLTLDPTDVRQEVKLGFSLITDLQGDLFWALRRGTTNLTPRPATPAVTTAAYIGAADDASVLEPKEVVVIDDPDATEPQEYTLQVFTAVAGSRINQGSHLFGELTI